MSEKHFIRNILIYLAIAVAVAISVFMLSHYVIGWDYCEYYFLLTTVIFCTCLILHKLGELKGKK